MQEFDIKFYNGQRIIDTGSNLHEVLNKHQATINDVDFYTNNKTDKYIYYNGKWIIDPMLIWS